MRRSDLRALCKHLQDKGLDYVLVGGIAIDMAGYSTGTEDVDFAVTLKEFAKAMAAVSNDRKFRDVEDQRTIGGGQFFTGTRWIDVEFINPILFRGAKSDDEFIDYIKKHRSRRTELGSVALPEVAWYMRLTLPDWEIYVQNILRDVRAGVPVDVLDGVLAISRTLGNLPDLGPRVGKTRQMAQMLS